MEKRVFKIEERIKPLVDALNKVSYIKTISSCEGHFDDEIDSLKDRSFAEVIFEINKESKKDLEGLMLNILEGVREDFSSRINTVNTDIHNRYFMNVGLENNWVIKITPTHYICKNNMQKRDYTDSEIKKISDVIYDYLKYHPENMKI